MMFQGSLFKLRIREFDQLKTVSETRCADRTFLGKRLEIREHNFSWSRRAPIWIRQPRPMLQGCLVQSLLLRELAVRQTIHPETNRSARNAFVLSLGLRLLLRVAPVDPSLATSLLSANNDNHCPVANRLALSCEASPAQAEEQGMRRNNFHPLSSCSVSDRDLPDEMWSRTTLMASSALISYGTVLMMRVRLSNSSVKSTTSNCAMHR